MPIRRRPQCQADAASTGERCRNYARLGSRFCGSHAGDTGRKSKFTPERRAQMLLLLRTAHFKSQICKQVRISEATLYNWIERAELEREQGGGEFLDFLEEFEAAEAEGESILISRLQTASQEGDTKATLELLRRRYRDRWGDHAPPEAPPKKTASGPPESQSDPERLTVQERLKYAELLEKSASTSKDLTYREYQALMSLHRKSRVG